MAITRESFDGIIENAYNRLLNKLSYKAPNTEEVLPCPASIPYTGAFDAFGVAQDARDANEWPKDSEIVSMLNARRKAQAVAKARQDALDAFGVIKPDMENDEYLQLLTVYKGLAANKKKYPTDAQARAAASQFTGIEWPDGK